MGDFVTLLTEDHRRVEELFTEFEETGDAAVARQIFLELTVHTMVEDEMLYGLYSAKVDNAGAAAARAEHQEAKDLIGQLEGMEAGTDEFAATMTQLKTAVAHHVDEEENKMFPKILEALPDTAPMLGHEMAARKAELAGQFGVESAAGMPPSVLGQKPVAGPEPGR